MPTKMNEQCCSAITAHQAPIQPQAETTPVTIPEAESDGIHNEVILLGCQTCTKEKDKNDERSDGICQLASASKVLESIAPSPSQQLEMAEPPKQIDLSRKTERMASKSMVYGIDDLERPDPGRLQNMLLLDVDMASSYQGMEESSLDSNLVYSDRGAKGATPPMIYSTSQLVANVGSAASTPCPVVPMPLFYTFPVHVMQTTIPSENIWQDHLLKRDSSMVTVFRHRKRLIPSFSKKRWMRRCLI